MIVAPGGDRRPDENTVDEQGRRDLLQPQPGVAERSRQDVERDRKRKAEQREPADPHQDDLERIESSPFQVPLASQQELKVRAA